MTREDLKKHWEVIEAFKDGAVIEYRPFPHDKWYETQEITLGVGCEYRIAKRDWAWACEMMLGGKRVKRRELSGGDLLISNGHVSTVSSDGSILSPAPVYASDLLATDWRIA